MKKGILALMCIIGIVLTMNLSVFEESYLWPAPTVRTITQYYSSSHDGLDIAAKGDHNIVATKSGTVDRVARSCQHVDSGYAGCEHTNTYGNYVRINHGNNIYSVYGHLMYGTITVNVGDYVQQGQVIGKMGSSGMSTGQHLHFEIRSGSTRLNVNPSNIGYVYQGNTSGYVDLGTDFYATINHVKNNYAVSYDSNGYLELVENGVNDKTRWHFMRQDDGSYIIHLNVSSMVMDVTNANTSIGASIGISNVNYGSAQKWYIYEEDGSYVFKSQLSNYVFDVKYPYGSIGDNLQLWEPNKTQAQHFKINRVVPFNDWVYIHNESETPVLYSDEDVIFTYDAVTSYFYDLWLYKDGAQVGQLYAGNSKTYRQRYTAGNYELLFASQNDVGWNYGRFHPFKVVDRTRKVSFDANGGTTAQTEKILQYNTKYGELLPAIRDGYEFKGWYTSAESGTQITAESLCDSVSNITLYAQWEEVTPYTASTVIKNGSSYTVNTEWYGLPTSYLTMVAGYKGDKLVSTKFADVGTCTLSGDIDEIKVLVWDGFDSLKPICKAEKITSDKFIIE